ncbi:Protein of unknown function [Pustulibacterium marinum]|uniref:Tll0287-like domain-containing protein n=1 Tax=Pustulibacterium marinum TaxID=1224947 RepID=A0A1I7F0S2_9FLAO|nr:DUF3365 domain-containing protein [Pustulibacterium marinum]SFU29781.1 Protein of unknown function [Pustulibacterium marinum]
MRILYTLLLIVLVGCKSDPEKKEVTEAYKPEEAHALLTQKCYVGHSVTAEHDSGRIAPPMVAVKTRYLKEANSKEEFIQAISAFVNEPSEGNAKMRGAVKRFGVMPYQQFSKEELSMMAAFMYDYQLESPEWFAEHYQEKHSGNFEQEGKVFQTKTDEKSYAEIGMNYALETKKVLGKNLMGKMQQESPVAALTFCNVQALPLTDSMATKYNATIKRVSDKNRNPVNAANTEEVGYINEFQKIVAAGEKVKPIVKEEGDSVHFYAPIVTNAMCLKCHGTEATMAPEVRMKLPELYPMDKAIGYSENEVRGIWSITFDKQ